MSCLKYTKSIQFLDGFIYAQIGGVAMGYSSGEHFHELRVQHRSSIDQRGAYYRYVEDTFILSEELEQANTFLESINSTNINLNIKEENDNNNLSILNANIKHRDDGPMNQRVHHKHGKTQYLHYKCAHLVRYK